MKHFKSQKTNSLKEQYFIEQLLSLSEDDINKFIEQAKSLGISQDQINQGLKLIYDKYGNIVYGNQLYNGIVIKGYYGNNGSGNTPHFQLIKLPIRCYC